jgi:hypothetical protein
MAGSEWVAHWRLGQGNEVKLLAHPQIGKLSSTWSTPPMDVIRSISSDLVPDAVIAVTTSLGTRLILVDAKERLVSTPMDAMEVAEAASKYIWGIRYSDSSISDLPIISAIIVSSMPAGQMHSSESRIAAVQCLPSWTTEFGDVLESLLSKSLAA